jgi:hypothetical protein
VQQLLKEAKLTTQQAGSGRSRGRGRWSLWQQMMRALPLMNLLRMMMRVRMTAAVTRGQQKRAKMMTGAVMTMAMMMTATLGTRWEVGLHQVREMWMRKWGS